MLVPVLDLHSHLLPGLDDGAASLADSLEMARAAVEAGIAVVAATPHVRADYPTEPRAMEEALAAVRTAVAEAGIPLEVLPGGELALDRLELLEPGELARFGLGGNPHCLLLEFPYTGWPLGLGEQVFRLRTAGIRPVLAHPERNPEVQARPERLGSLIESGALVQVTAASLDGRLGRASRQAGLALLGLGFVHLLASDAHAPEVREIGMAAAAATVGSDELARWLTVELPAALVAAGPLPPRPAASRRRSWAGLSRLRERLPRR